MKLTYIALLGSMLAFTACDNSTDEFGSTEVEDPRIETNTTSPNPNNQTQSGASSSQTRQPVNPSNLPPVPPRDENIQVTPPPSQPRN